MDILGGGGIGTGTGRHERGLGRSWVVWILSAECNGSMTERWKDGRWKEYTPYV